VVRSLTPEELQMIKRAAEGYVERARHYRASLKPLPLLG
jgi:ribosome biogenesis protein Nip4